MEAFSELLQKIVDLLAAPEEAGDPPFLLCDSEELEKLTEGRPALNILKRTRVEAPLEHGL